MRARAHGRLVEKHGAVQQRVLLPSRRMNAPLNSAVQRMWHIHDSQGQILPLAFRRKSPTPFMMFPPRSEAVGPAAGAQKAFCVKRELNQTFLAMQFTT